MINLGCIYGRLNDKGHRRKYSLETSRGLFINYMYNILNSQNFS
jgi:hypothetical protein